MKLKLLIIFFAVAISACDQRSAKEIGEDLAQEKVDLVKGAGEILKDQGEDVASIVAEGVGNVFSGLGKGFDKSLAKEEIRIEDGIPETLVKVSRAQRLESNPTEKRKGLSVYFLSQDGINDAFVLRAYSGENEVGRSSAEVNIEKDGTSYVDFEFDERTPFSSVDYYLLSRK